MIGWEIVGTTQKFLGNGITLLQNDSRYDIMASDSSACLDSMFIRIVPNGCIPWPKDLPLYVKGLVEGEMLRYLGPSII